MSFCVLMYVLKAPSSINCNLVVLGIWEVVVFPRRKPIGGLGHWDCMRDLVVLGIWDSMCSDPLGSLCSCHIHTLHLFYLMPHNFFQSFIIFPFLFLRVIGNGLMGPYHHFLYEIESNCYIGALLGIYHSFMRELL